MQLYAAAKQDYDFLTTMVVTPYLSPLVISEEIGRIEESHRRAAAGGEALKERVRLLRDAIKPHIYHALAIAPDGHLKSPTSACDHIFNDWHGRPIPDVVPRAVFTKAAMRDVVKEIFGEIRAMLQNGDKTKQDATYFKNFRQQAKLAASKA